MIKIFTTGGTIDKIYFDKKDQFNVGQSMVGEILSEANISINYEITPILSKDSLDITDQDRSLILKRIRDEKDSKIIVTHGTDTMVETALFLSDIRDKTVVFTGSMQPARLRNSDATFNIGYAIAALQLLDPGIYIAINGRIFDPETTRKVREKCRFENVESY